MRRRWLLTSALVLAACSSGGGSKATTVAIATTQAPAGAAAPDPSTTDTTVRHTTFSLPAAPLLPTTAATTPPPAPAPASVDRGDWDGTRFDVGLVKDVKRAGAATSVVFDRVQIYVGDQLVSGPQLTEEPIIYGNTDVPYENDNPKTRRFVLAPAAKLLELGEPRPCAFDTGSEGERQPVWVPITVDALVGGAWKQYQQTSLIFDGNGQILQLRLSQGC